MRTADKPEFARMLTDALAFWRQDVSTFSLGVWWKACEQFELEQVSKALGAHALDPERGRFAPMPTDVVKALQGTHADRSLVAWGTVHEAMRLVGAYRSVCFDDPAINAAVEDMGGWPTICRTEIDELPFLQKRFCDLHRSYSARGTFAHPAYLMGATEQENRLQGRASPRPVLIGDATKAAKVLKHGTSGPKTAITSAAQALRLAFGEETTQ